MKKYLVLAASALALAGCSSDDFVGDSNGNVKNSNAAINFSSETGAITRASSTNGSTNGQDAATALGNNFVVFGYKNDNSTTTVFDHYNVNYKDGTNGSTVTNTKGWEYVGQSMNVKGVKDDNKKLAKNATAQTIKYWDYSAASYNFLAFSMGNGHATTTGEGDNTTYATPTAVDKDKLATAAYTLTGDAETLAECYISDIQTVQKANYKDGAVQMQFRHLTSKVRVALYETVPGYVVSDVKFYTDNTTETSTDKATLYGNFNSKGIITVKFPTTGTANKDKTDYNKAHIAFSKEKDQDTDAYVSSLEFSNVSYGNQAENSITKGSTYLSQSSSSPSYCGDYKKVIPAEDNSQKATLRIDYKLTSTDGSNEVINVKNATAVVPAAYTAWQPGYAYIYIFKISENTNGGTGGSSDPSGLTAISFDAVVLADEATGNQTTITTVADPSITTIGYKDNACVTGDEYTANTEIYATVHLPKATVTSTDGNSTTSNWDETDLAPQKLYTVTIDNDAAQAINEASVANAIAKGTQSTDNNNKTYTVTDASGKKMIVTETANDFATTVTSIPTPGGSTKNVNALKWTAAANTIYVVEYTEERKNTQNNTEVQHPNFGKKSYKIVRTK